MNKLSRLICLFVLSLNVTICFPVFSSDYSGLKNSIVDDTIRSISAQNVYDSKLRFLQSTGRDNPLNITVTSHNENQFPDLESVISITNQDGDPVNGLTEQNFEISESTSQGTINVTNFSVEQIVDNNSPLSIAIVIDRSWSMRHLVGNSGKTRLQIVTEEACEFVEQMSELDRASITIFDDWPNNGYYRTLQTMTSDTGLLKTAIRSINDPNGHTPLYSGVYEGLRQIVCESGITALVVLSDGQPSLPEPEEDPYDEDDVITFANSLNTPIYSIYIGDGLNTTMMALSEQTSGIYYNVSALDVGVVYNDIRSILQNQYLLTFTSPTPTCDGTERNVGIDVTNVGVSASGSYSYTAPGSGFVPLGITLTPATIAIKNSPQDPTLPVEISVTVNPPTVSDVTLFYRTIGTENGYYSETLMGPQTGSFRSAIIPGPFVLFPGVEFYISACEGDKVLITSPSFPHIIPHAFAVAPDTAPLIVHTVPASFTIGNQIGINATITDNTDFLQSARLYYRSMNTGSSYESTAMTLGSENNYSAYIPAAYAKMPGVEYFIAATDNHNLTSTHGTSDYPNTITQSEISFNTLESSYCESEPPVYLTGNPPGGIFSGTGVVNSTFYPSYVNASSPTDVTITYKYYYNETEYLETSQITTIYPSEFKINALNPSCDPGGDGSLSISVIEGGNDYAYSWTTTNGTIPVGQQHNSTISPIPTGDYQIEFVDNGYGCPVQTRNVNLVNPIVSVTVSNLAVCENTTTVVEAECTRNVNPPNSLPPYTFEYTWIKILPDNSTVIMYTGFDDHTSQLELSPGNYKLQVEDQNYKCTGEVFFKVYSLQVNLTIGDIKQITCYGANNGEATALATGGILPYLYKWYKKGSTGDHLILEGSAYLKDLEPGEYYATVTNENGAGCIIRSDVFQIQEPSLLALVEPINVTSCQATIKITGGTPDFTYSWYKFEKYDPAGWKLVWKFVGSTVSSARQISIPNLGVGSYKVTVNDANKCGEIAALFQVGEIGLKKEYPICFHFTGKPYRPAPEEPVQPEVLDPYVRNVIKTIKHRSSLCIAQAQAEMDEQFVNSCGTPEGVHDELSVSYTQNPYHYTAYYYDRAGNLVRTVPPKGVDTDAASRMDIPDHKMVTEYDYNNNNQVVRQKTPDGNETKFIYDPAGQLRFSQNAKQANATNLTFSYTKYDKLGRIVQTGECMHNGNLTWETLSSMASVSSFPTDMASNPLGYTEHNSQQVYTNYGPSLNPETYYGREQRFVDNRVNCTYTDNVYTYYSYDPHGNVEWIKQSIVGFKPCYIGYEYDLISNKITKVKYNEGSESDRFFHRYSYDEDNRLVLVETSRDNYLWEKDGTYKYYPHGPLKSLEIGEDNLQKVDYSYTIQGWLKGINYPSEIGTPEEEFPNDLYVTSLQYFAKNPVDPNDKGDYLSRATVLNHDDNHAYSNSRLYNGNITSWTSKYDLSSLPSIVQSGFKYNVATGFEFSYDKLNRLKQSQFRFKDGVGWAENNNQFNQYNTSYTYDPNGNITNLTRNVFGSTTEQVKMDDLDYEYPVDGSNNKLNSVTETLLPGSNANGLHNDITGVHNYTYDEIGNLVSDLNGLEGIASIEWNVYGKIASVTHDANSALPDLEFVYDALGNRIIKKCIYKNPASVITYYYIRDVQGNIMSIYSGTSVPGTQPETFIVEEQPIYGSSRLGTLATGATVTDTKTSTGIVYYRQLGQKSYELTDHLGNVRAVISDYIVKLNATTLSAQLMSVNDYYPFGMGMPGRLYNTDQYRFGFGGVEKNDEINGSGNSYDFLFRIYDPRLARFLSLDPLQKNFPALTPYQFAGNSPIIAIDLEGLEPATINPNAQTLIFVLQGYGGDPQDGQTQAQNAGGDLGIDKTGLGRIAQAASGASQIQVITYASSSTKNTKEDVKKTIMAFKAQNSGGKIVIVGHSGGGDNAIELAKENPNIQIDLLITLDTQDPKVFGVDDNNITSNVKNVINYYQNTEGIGSEKVDILDSKSTNGANILSPGSNHRSIDNDQVGNVALDINNFLQGKDAVKIAKNRKYPTYDPANSKSQDIGGVAGFIKDIVNPKSIR